MRGGLDILQLAVDNLNALAHIFH